MTVVPVFGIYSAYAEAMIYFLCAVAFGLLCHKMRDVKDDGSTPNLVGHAVSTVTFSGVMLMGYPFMLLTYSLLPTMSYRLNQFSRLPYGFDGAEFLQCEAFFALLCLSVAFVKSVEFRFDKKTVLTGGMLYFLMSTSFQNMPSDFFFGCFIISYLIRYGSVMVAGAYILIYKYITLFLDFWVYNLIGDIAINLSSSLGEIFGTFCLFAAVLLTGIYLDIRFIEKKKRMPVFTAFTIPSILLLAVIGYFTLNYTRM